MDHAIGNIREARIDAAIEQYRRTLELDPNFAPTHLVLGQAYEQQGRLAETIAELQHADLTASSFSWRRWPGTAVAGSISSERARCRWTPLRVPASSRSRTGIMRPER
ncbi:MAG: hypothetical protein DMF84_16270 [Acidobacteria bacterium]|nr:MAG: hypothetical protein DMF84_16270 [Acidobacteriota bacterium]